MNYTPRPGTLLVTKDPRDLFASRSILAAPTGQRETCSGFVHAHNVSSSWHEVNLTHKRIVFEAYAGRSFRAAGRRFYILREESILAVFQRRASMNRDTLIEKVAGYIKSVWPENIEEVDTSELDVNAFIDELDDDDDETLTDDEGNDLEGPSPNEPETAQ